MAGNEIDRVNAAARRDDELIVRAAKRTGLAGTALACAAGDLRNAHSRNGTLLTGLAEAMLDDAERIVHLVRDIESHRPIPADGRTGEDARHGRHGSAA